jgi:mono/diheme cytochrome c family protein
MQFTSRAARRRGAGFLLVATSAIVLAACGGNSKDTNKNDGTGTAPTASTSTTTTATTETTAAAADGMKIFSNNCSICHGASGEGGNGGPPITSQKDAAHNIQQVTNGGGGMPAFGNQLSEEEIKAVATYVAGTLAK